ncbi:hypothetical protein DRQ16_04260 [bacterium]|nr:MAG: hypothetical protein DRQ16_04260 [bacterium]
MSKHRRDLVIYAVSSSSRKEGKGGKIFIRVGYGLRALFLVLLLYLFSGSFCQREDEESLPFQVISNTPGNSFCPEIAITPDGIIHVVWADSDVVTGDWRIMYSWREISARDWSEPEVIYDRGHAAWPTLRMDSLGNLHLLYGDWEPGTLFYACKPFGGEWGDLEVLPERTWLWYAQCDRENRFHLIYEPFSGGIVYHYLIRNPDGSWEGPYELPARADNLRFVIDDEGKVHLVEGGGSIFYSYGDRDGWSVSEMIYGSASAEWPDIALSRDGRLVVTWHDPRFHCGFGTYNIAYMVKEDTSWSSVDTFPMCGKPRLDRIFFHGSDLYLLWWKIEGSTADLYWSVWDGNEFETHRIETPYFSRNPDGVIRDGRLYLVWIEEMEPKNFEVVFRVENVKWSEKEGEMNACKNFLFIHLAPSSPEREVKEEGVFVFLKTGKERRERW